MYTFLGSNIKPLLKDLKEATLKSIEEKFEKIQVITPNNNTSNGKIYQYIAYRDTLFDLLVKHHLLFFP